MMGQGFTGKVDVPVLRMRDIIPIGVLWTSVFLYHGDGGYRLGCDLGMLIPLHEGRMMDVPMDEPLWGEVAHKALGLLILIIVFSGFWVGFWVALDGPMYADIPAVWCSGIVMEFCLL
ncbi:hypothetical protein Nepgr_028924 [Nepenthes gracilis]|uniref:Uncharacterized protein n=1 Tax=Nepenthes gracilis TaxID=150966 RepID=A0AAD3TDX8_NEPGR|nr:hypothetical protein Nepgr_028924 [Nepenthes gracilis]